jgi:hypothetical protein
LNIFETVANTNKSAKEFVIENYWYFVDIRWMQKL